MSPALRWRYDWVKRLYARCPAHKQKHTKNETFFSLKSPSMLSVMATAPAMYVYIIFRILAVTPDLAVTDVMLWWFVILELAVTAIILR